MLDRVIYYFNEYNGITKLIRLLTQEAVQILKHKIDNSSGMKPQTRIIDAENEQKNLRRCSECISRAVTVTYIMKSMGGIILPWLLFYTGFF